LTPSATTDAASKGYVDNGILAGAAKASTTVFGITELSTAPVTASVPIAVGTNDPRMATASEVLALAGNDTTIAVGSGNLFVTQTGLQNSTEKYASSTGSANAYVLTLSPVPTALKAGQIFSFLANFGCTGASTLNVNSLGAKNIYKVNGATALASGDIASGQLVTVAYDGTQFQMLSPVAHAVPLGVYSSGTNSDGGAPGTYIQTIAHGLGIAPKFIDFFGGSSYFAGSQVYIPFVGSYTSVSQSYLNIMSASIGGGAALYGFGYNSTSGNATLTGVVSVDATNIYIAWTNTNASLSVNISFAWKAGA
jgi:hypothetical protein